MHIQRLIGVFHQGASFPRLLFQYTMSMHCLSGSGPSIAMVETLSIGYEMAILGRWKRAQHRACSNYDTGISIHQRNHVGQIHHAIWLASHVIIITWIIRNVLGSQPATSSNHSTLVSWWTWSMNQLEYTQHPHQTNATAGTFISNLQSWGSLIQTSFSKPCTPSWLRWHHDDLQQSIYVVWYLYQSKTTHDDLVYHANPVFRLPLLLQTTVAFLWTCKT